MKIHGRYSYFRRDISMKLRRSRRIFAAAVSAVLVCTTCLPNLAMADTGTVNIPDTPAQENNAASPADLAGKKRETADAASPADLEGNTVEKSGAEESARESASAHAASEGSLEEKGIALIDDLHGTTMPAVDFSPVFFDDGSSVIVSAPEGAFPEGVTMTVDPVMTDQLLDAVGQAAGISDLTEDQVAAYDFNFYAEDGAEIEPEREITVRFEDLALAGENAPVVYHLEDAYADRAERKHVEASDVEDGKLSAEIVTDEFSIYAILRAPAGNLPEGAFWIGDDTAVTFGTLQEAVDAASEGDTIHMSGEIAAAAVTGAAVDKNITLDAAGDTTIEGSGTDNGFTLAEGSKLTTSDGAELTMSKFNMAITVKEGAEINDGTYTFDSVMTGLNLKGNLQGTDRENLKVTIHAIKDHDGLATGDNTRMNKATLIWTGGRNAWTYKNITAEDSHIEMNDVWLYSNPIDVRDSYFKISGRFNGDSLRGGHVLSVYAKPCTFTNSEVVVEGSRINVVNSEGLTLNDSTVTVKNSPDGGFNVNYGSVLNVHNSVIASENITTYPLIGAGYSSESTLRIDGSTVIETAAATRYDSVGANNGNFIVTGGTYKVYPGSLVESKAIPTNGAENGNEKLTYFTLTDRSVTELEPVNAIGGTYIYPVERANDDGQKRVWCPAAKVTFKLNNANAAFADGTTEDKTFRTIRGYGMTDVQGNTDPGTPEDAGGKAFLGWYYRDSAGVEHVFDWNTTKTDRDLEVYALWEGKTVIYHNGNGVNYVVPVEDSSSSVPAMTFGDIVSRKPDFAIKGKQFRYWTADEAGNGTPIYAGDNVNFSSDVKQVDLYAKLEDEPYPIHFSANGGRFSDGSIYKNPDYFTITQDANGGEVATLNRTAVYGQKLRDIAESLGLDFNLLKPDADAVMTGFEPEDTTYWYREKDCRNRIWSSESIYGEVTYYMKWRPTISADDTISAENSIRADLWNGSRDSEEESSRIIPIRSGDAISITGAVDVSSIKEQMDAIADQFGITDRNQYQNIQLSGAGCTFTAVFTLPAEVEMPSDASGLEITADGLGDCFDLVPGAEINSFYRRITVRFTLKDGMTDFDKLYRAVFGTGVSALLTDSEENTILLNIGGLRVGENAAADRMFHISGTVSGNFRAVATMGASGAQRLFQFGWTGAQAEIGKDAADTEGITVSYRTYLPVELLLPGDLTTEGAVNSRAVRNVSNGQKISYIGRLDVNSIKDQIRALNEPYEGRTITVRNVTSTFTARIVLPDGLTVPQDLSANVSFTDNDLFALDTASVRQEGNTVIVPMKLKKTYTLFSDLYRDVINVPNPLEVTVSDIVVGDDVPDDSVLTAVGFLEGSFYGEAYSEAGTEKVFAFDWTGVQSTDPESLLGDGTDDAGNADAITYTVKTPEKVKNPEKLALPGDILINGDTEHDAVYLAKKGNSLRYRAELDVSKIQNQMREVEKDFYQVDRDRYSEILLSDLESTFTAKFTLPDALTELWPGDEAGYTLSGTSAFAITSVTKDGNTVTVVMSLEPGIDNYADLEDAILNRTESVLKLDVRAFTVPSSLADDTNYTVTGELSGSMQSMAALGSSEQGFSFCWYAVQRTDPDGTDAIYAGSSSENPISATFKAAEEDTTEEPTEPTEPTTPTNPDEPTTPTTPSNNGGSSGSGGSHSSGGSDDSDTPVIRNVTEADDTVPTDGVQEETVEEAEMRPGSPEGGSSVIRKDSHGAVRTGDPTPILLYILLVLVSGGALIGMRVFRKKNHR